MNIFIAGGRVRSGAFLVPLLVHAGHKVVALTRSVASTSQPSRWGLCRWSAMCTTKRGSLDWSRSPKRGRHPSAHRVRDQGRRSLRGNIRVRIEGTRNLVSAARAAGCVDSSRRAFRSCARRSVAD